MNDLEMIKAFAKLEGVELHKDTTIYKSMFCDARRLARPSMTNKEIEKRMYGCENSNYNPLLPNALNCAARDKYHAEVDYDDMEVFIYGSFICDENDSSLPISPSAKFECEEGIPRAVIECILKSKGLWK